MNDRSHQKVRKDNSSSYKPVVSVCITTYNHEPYIAQALDSVLAQETNFNFEILLGEDDSSDRTRDICIEYANKYPDRIRLFLNDRRKVICFDGVATGRWNFTNNINHAKGKYISIIEGDDYWIDRKKLQIQVDLLENNSKSSMCFHDAFILSESSGKCTEFSEHLEKSYRVNPYDCGDIKEFGIKDVLEKWMIPTASILYRREFLVKFPKWYCKIFSGDRALHLLLADKGNIIFKNRKMSIWRRHSTGLSSYIGGAWLQKNKLHLLHEFNKYKEYKYDKLLAQDLAYGFEKISYGAKPNLANIKVNKSIYNLFISMNYYKRLGVLTPERRLKMLAKWMLNMPDINTFRDIFK